MKERSGLNWIIHYLLITQIFWIPARLPEHVRLFFYSSEKDSLLLMMLRNVSASQNRNGYTYMVNGVKQMALIKNVKKEGGIQNRRMCILWQRYNSMLAVGKKPLR